MGQTDRYLRLPCTERLTNVRRLFLEVCPQIEILTTPLINETENNLNPSCHISLCDFYYFWKKWSWLLKSKNAQPKCMQNSDMAIWCFRLILLSKIKMKLYPIKKMLIVSVIYPKVSNPHRVAAVWWDHFSLDLSKWLPRPDWATKIRQTSSLSCHPRRLDSNLNQTDESIKKIRVEIYCTALSLLQL